MQLADLGYHAFRVLDLTNLNHLRVRRAMELAHHDIGVREKPRGSNRGAVIDRYCDIAGSPRGSFWCACAVTTWWKDAGLEVPPLAPTWWAQHKKPPTGPGACDAWLWWGLITGRWSETPAPGAAVLYGVSKGGVLDAQHIGLLLEHDPDDGTLLAIEGNTTLSGFSRNGELVTLKAVDTDRLLGYVHPLPLT